MFGSSSRGKNGGMDVDNGSGLCYIDNYILRISIDGVLQALVA